MEEGLKYVGAGLATLAMFGAALGVGNIFSSYLDAAMRNPSAAPQQQGGFGQQAPQQQSAKVNPQEPTIDFDDDIPF